MADHLRTEIVLEALDMATQQRSPEDTVHHSDQGSQYTAIAFGQRCEDEGVRPSMGSVGDCYDNAMCPGLICYPRMRTHRAHLVYDPIGGASRCLRLRGRLVQSTQIALGPRLRVSIRLRERVLPRTTAPYGASITCRGMKACDCPLYRGSSKTLPRFPLVRAGSLCRSSRGCAGDFPEWAQFPVRRRTCSAGW